MTEVGLGNILTKIERQHQLAGPVSTLLTLSADYTVSSAICSAEVHLLFISPVANDYT